MRLLTLKFFVFTLFIGFESLAADSLFSCAPQGGQLSPDQTYVTYTLDKNGSDDDLTMALRKTVVGPGDESTLEKMTYSLAFMYSEREMGFDFGYMVGEDLFLMSGEFFSQPRTSSVLAKAIILLEFKNTAKLFQGLMEPPVEIQNWQCLVNIDEMRKFKSEDNEGPMTLSKLKAHFKLKAYILERKKTGVSEVFSRAVDLKKVR